LEWQGIAEEPSWQLYTLRQVSIQFSFGHMYNNKGLVPIHAQPCALLHICIRELICFASSPAAAELTYCLQPSGGMLREQGSAANCFTNA